MIGLDFYLKAFFSLQSDRPMGMSGLGQIPYSSLELWAKNNGIKDIDDFDDFETIIRKMEHALNKFQEQQKGNEKT